MKCGQLCGHFVSLPRQLRWLGHITRCMRFGLIPHPNCLATLGNFAYTWTFPYFPRLIKYIAANTPIIANKNSKPGIGRGVGDNVGVGEGAYNGAGVGFSNSSFTSKPHSESLRTQQQLSSFVSLNTGVLSTSSPFESLKVIASSLLSNH